MLHGFHLVCLSDCNVICVFISWLLPLHTDYSPIDETIVGNPCGQVTSDIPQDMILSPTSAIGKAGGASVGKGLSTDTSGISCQPNCKSLS